MSTPSLPPPYMSFGILLSATETLATTVVPSGPIDRRVLDGLSGADYGALMSGLRFLGLVDEQRVATPQYRALVQAHKDGEAKFKPALWSVINAAYKPITGSINIEHGTIAQVEKAFKDTGVSQGQMLTKTIRFYVKALSYVGASVSVHITKAKSSRPSAPKNGEPKPKKKAHSAATKRTITQEDAPPTGTERLPIPGLPDAYIQYPATITEANCDLFDAMITVLRTYVKGRKEKKP